jgi:pimeloyl-ACP methyl ester carboxylesterase
VLRSKNMPLFFQETGNPTAPTIILLHGGGGAGWMWKPQVEQLGEFHCLVPDLPEQGQSAAEKPFSIAGSAALVADLIRSRANNGKAHLVGLSEGAQVAVALMAQSPELLESAILSSALVRPLPGSALITPELIAWSYRWFVAPLKNNDWWIRINMQYAAGVPEKYFQEFRRSFQELNETGFTNLMIENQRFRIPPGLESVQVPTLIVCGQNEYAAMRQSARDLAGTLPKARAYTVRHHNKLSMAEEHNWNMTAPALFTAMLRAWFNRQHLPEELRPVT